MNKPEYLNCSADVVGGLIETVAVSLMDNFPSSTVDTEDVGMVLDALHVLRPDAPELDALDGIMSIVAGRYDDAVRVLSQVTETAPRFTYARALLAFSLAAKGDPAWRQHAGEVLDDHDAGDAQKLVRVLIARHDLMNARRASKMGAGFVMPESVTALLDTQQGSTAARPASAPREQAAVDMHHQMGFLRA